MGPISGMRVARPVGEHGSQGRLRSRNEGLAVHLLRAHYEIVAKSRFGREGGTTNPNSRGAFAERGPRGLHAASHTCKTLVYDPPIVLHGACCATTWSGSRIYEGQPPKMSDIPHRFKVQGATVGLRPLLSPCPSPHFPIGRFQLLSEPCRPNGPGILYVVEKGKISRRPFLERHRAG